MVDVSKKMDLHSEEFLHMLMRRQFSLSTSIASVFVVIIAGVPLLNLYLPEVMNMPILGFTLSWLILGFMIFPVLIALAILFVRQSNAFEDEAVGYIAPSSAPRAVTTAPAHAEDLATVSK